MKKAYKKIYNLLLPLAIGIFTMFPGSFFIQEAYGFSSPSLATGSATLAVYPMKGILNRGCSYLLSIGLSTGGLDTDGADVILFYNPAVLNMHNILDGGFYPSYVINSIDSNLGKVSISGLSSVFKPVNKKGVFAQLNFTVLPEASSSSTTLNFDFDPTNPTKTTDSNVVQSVNVVDILRTVYNGNYKIGNGAC